MPKIVDHEQRRRELAEALWRVIAESGPTAVSIRSVAAEAGWSPGSLRHYFQPREELLVFAMNLSEDRVTARITSLSAAHPAGMPLTDRVAQYAEQLLPLDGLALELMVTPGMLDADDARHRLRSFLVRIGEARLYRAAP